MSASKEQFVDSEPASLRAGWRWWLGPALLALILALLFVDPFAGEWDALDYTTAAINGTPASALGRSLFIFYNHALWIAARALFGLRPEQAYLVFKYAVVAQAPLAVIACWALGREATRSAAAATVAALLLALSPAFVVYSGQVMTEIPALLFTSAALYWYLRGAREQRLSLLLLGALLLGAGVNVRDTVAYFGLWLVLAPLACGWRWQPRNLLRVGLAVLVFLISAVGPFLVWYWLDMGAYRAAWHGWLASIRMEAARHPISWRNLQPFAFFFFMMAPLIFIALPAAAWREWRRRRSLTPLLALAASGLVAQLLLLSNYSTTINWRYFLTGLPALAPLVAAYFIETGIERWGTAARAFKVAVAGVLLIGLIQSLMLQPSRAKLTARHALNREYRARLALVPPDAVVMAGGQAVAVNYWRSLGLGAWDSIGTGGGWPGAQLVPVIENYLNAGRRVFLDTDPRLWDVCGWQTAETRVLPALEERFRFRHLSETLYEIRPPNDVQATDQPRLSQLLPEQRPADVSRCLGNRIN